MYVIDASGSMIDTLPMAIDYVIQSARALAPEDRFAIVIYQHGRSHEPIPDGLGPPTPARLAALRAWLDPFEGRVHSRGTSHPGDALERAFTYNPHRIVLLSDHTGPDAPDRFAAQLDRLNANRETSVRVVQFFATDHAATLAALARSHGGDYEWIHRITPPPSDTKHISGVRHQDHFALAD